MVSETIKLHTADFFVALKDGIDVNSSGCVAVVGIWSHIATLKNTGPITSIHYPNRLSSNGGGAVYRLFFLSKLFKHDPSKAYRDL